MAMVMVRNMVMAMVRDMVMAMVMAMKQMRKGNQRENKLKFLIDIWGTTNSCIQTIVWKFKTCVRSCFRPYIIR